MLSAPARARPVPATGCGKGVGAAWVGCGGAGDTARAAVLAGPADLLLDGLHLHHTGEDLLLWPKLLDRCPPDAALVRRMEEQHERVEDHTRQLRGALDRWRVGSRGRGPALRL